jgi:hypothetical protein
MAQLRRKVPAGCGSAGTRVVMQVANVGAADGLGLLLVLAMLIEDLDITGRDHEWEQLLEGSRTCILDGDIVTLALGQCNIVLVGLLLRPTEQNIARHLRHRIEAVSEGSFVVGGPDVLHLLEVPSATKHTSPLVRPSHVLRPGVDPIDFVGACQRRTQLVLNRVVHRALSEKQVLQALLYKSPKTHNKTKTEGHGILCFGVTIPRRRSFPKPGRAQLTEAVRSNTSYHDSNSGYRIIGLLL